MASVSVNDASVPVDWPGIDVNGNPIDGLAVSYRVDIGLTAAANQAVVGSAKVGYSVVGDPSAGGVAWTTLPKVESINTSRGRQDQLARFEQGRMTVVVPNHDGRYSPFNTASPYYPNVKPGRRIRAVMTYGGVDYPLFYGYIERVTPSMPQNRNYTATIQAFDLFGRMARDELNLTMALQLSGARANAILNLLSAGLPSSQRDIDAGRSTLPAVTLSQTKQLQHMQDIAQIEDAQYWVTPAGVFVFRDRSARRTRTESTVSQGVYGIGGIGAQSLASDYSCDYALNDWKVTRSGGIEQDALDAASIVDNGALIQRISSPNISSDSDALSMARWYLGNTSTAKPWLKGLHVERDNTDAVWRQIINRDINHRITVNETTPGSFGLDGDYWIEGVRHQITASPKHHTMDLLLSPAESNYWAVVGGARVGSAHVTF